MKIACENPHILSYLDKFILTSGKSIQIKLPMLWNDALRIWFRTSDDG
jgi:hypothetical protein